MQNLVIAAGKCSQRLKKDEHVRSNKRTINNGVRPTKVGLQSGRQDLYGLDAHSY